MSPINNSTLHHHNNAIKKVTDVLFEKKQGADNLISDALAQHPHSASLLILKSINIVFSFSEQTISTSLPSIVEHLYQLKTDHHQQKYIKALEQIIVYDFSGALATFIAISELYPFDKIAILMIETMGFIAGIPERCQIQYKRLMAYHAEDPNFLSMTAFLYCHLDKKQQAKTLVEKALYITPHNAWAQHVMAHTIDENNPSEVEVGIEWMLLHQNDWPKQNRFFEGHNWMHTCTLMIEQ